MYFLLLFPSFSRFFTLDRFSFSSFYFYLLLVKGGSRRIGMENSNSRSYNKKSYRIATKRERERKEKIDIPQNVDVSGTTATTDTDPSCDFFSIGSLILFDCHFWPCTICRSTIRFSPSSWSMNKMYYLLYFSQLIDKFFYFTFKIL